MPHYAKFKKTAKHINGIVTTFPVHHNINAQGTQVGQSPSPFQGKSLSKTILNNDQSEA